MISIEGVECACDNPQPPSAAARNKMTQAVVGACGSQRVTKAAGSTWGRLLTCVGLVIRLLGRVPIDETADKVFSTEPARFLSNAAGRSEICPTKARNRDRNGVAISEI